jgi:serine protease AprX
MDVPANPSPLRRTDLEVASFSSRGPTLVDGLMKPDIVAPGTRIVAASTRQQATLTDKTVPDRSVPNTAAGGIDKAYAQLSGTSFSAPVVSGIVALML